MDVENGESDALHQHAGCVNTAAKTTCASTRRGVGKTHPAHQAPHPSSRSLNSQRAGRNAAEVSKNWRGHHILLQWVTSGRSTPLSLSPPPSASGSGFHSCACTRLGPEGDVGPSRCRVHASKRAPESRSGPPSLQWLVSPSLRPCHRSGSSRLPWTSRRSSCRSAQSGGRPRPGWTAIRCSRTRPCGG